MQNDESKEMARKEAIARLKIAREQGQRNSEKLERDRSLEIEKELWKVSKQVKKHDSQFIVIAPTLSGRLMAILIFSIAIFIGVMGVIGVINREASLLSLLNFEIHGSLTFLDQWLNPILIVISVGLILYSLLKLISHKTVMDKSTQSIMVQTSRFKYIPWKYNILFSEVRNVVIDYEQRSIGGGQERTTYYDVWMVSLDIGGEKTRKVKICEASNQQTFLPSFTPSPEDEMHDLALGISKFIRKEFNISSYKPDPLSPEKTFDMDKLPRDWKL